MKYYTAIVAIALLLVAAPFALAANGDGVVVSYKPNVASTGDNVVLKIKMTNDATDGKCIDEILIMPPDNWTGTAKVDEYSRSSYTPTNQESNDNVNLVTDFQSVRIVPDNFLCVGETVEIEISGLIAPNNYEVSDIVIKTSDQSNSGSPPSQVYKTIDTLIPGKGFALPKVYVTKATQLKLEYFHISGFSNTGFTGTAFGASARLKELYVKGQAGASIKVEIMTNAAWHTIYTGGTLTGGIDTLIMNYAGWIPATMDTAVLQSGYVKDGSSASYRITLGTGSLELKGEKEDIRNDPDYLSSGLTGAKGTIITAGSSEQRKINVQLVDDKGYDVSERIPLEAETDLGLIIEAEPYMTDTDGNKYFTLNTSCANSEYGIANVEISTDPLKTTPSVTEYVGIDSNVPASFAVVEGDGAKVPAGESQLIKVEVYDSCGNLVSNTHVQKVEFTYLTATCGPDKNKLSQTPGGPSNDYEYEDTIMGIADVYLNTDCQLCTHDVMITAGALPGSPKTIQLYGVNGPPVKMKVTADKHTIQANECVEATVEVVDACGNVVSKIPSEVGDEMEQWESIVRVTIDKPLQVSQPGWASSSQTYIADSDFREESIYQPYVQGKLTRGVGHVTICGCQGIGLYDIVAKSDTIADGKDTVNVINANPDCIEVTTVDQLLQCEKEAKIDVAIKDVCGNYWINQGNCGDKSQYCVNLGLSGTCDEGDAELSTETVCVDVGVGGPGYLEIPAKLMRQTDDCCAVDIIATKGTGCCGTFPTLQQCDTTKVLFHGAPSYMTTQFFKTRKVCEAACPVGIACVDEIQGGNTVHCYEQLHEELKGDEEVAPTETVSEEVLDLFTVYDSCGHIVKDYNGTIDVEVRGEDTASIYQVDHPLTLENNGLCTGKVQCRDLTQFGKDKCKETNKCSWNQDGDCSGTPVCTVINTKTKCGQATGCIWIGGSATNGYYCEGTSTRDCNGLANQENCENVGCAWTDTSTCQGEAVTNNCAPYTKEQCQMVGGKVTNSCEWIADCTREFENSILKKLVIHNTKQETQKQWIPLEKDDIIVDKLAFQLTYEQDPALWLYVYLESEKTPGFQNGEDRLVGKAPALFGEPTIIELEDSPTPYSDDQRQGGVLIRAGDSRDFYVMLVNENGPMPYIPCGTYGLDFLYYQDYNSPDLTNSGSGYPDKNGDGIIDLGPLSGVVEDGCINSDNFNWIGPGSMGPGPFCPNSGPGMNLRKDARNDDYKYTTPDYGFGDRFLYGLTFDAGQAWIKFRDLVAEDVDVITSDVVQSGEVCQYSGDLDVETPEEITFVEQPATQIKLINHDACDGTKTAICEGEWDAKDNAYLLNIQTTDGFDNPHGKAVEVELEYCLKAPFGDWFVEDVLQKYCMFNHDDEICDAKWMDKERCFTREDLKKVIKNSGIGEYFGDVLFGDYFGQEFSDWVNSYFDEAKVEFWDIGGHTLPYDSHGHQVVITDSNGQAQVYVTAQKTGLYKIIAKPLALDAASTYVNFGAGIPEKLDLMALPAFGVPADGEQEAMLFLRALDECGNLVNQPVYGVTVSVTRGEQVYISQDFEGKNNYDGDVTGSIYGFGWTKLAVLSDNYGTPVPDGLPQTATLTASAYGLDNDSTNITFAGAPIQLKITEITPSDRLPADGETGAWVTIEVQDKNGNRVTGYLGDGFSGDPGDPWGMTDYTFNDICLDLDTVDGSFFGSKMIDADDQYTFGWVNLHHEGPGKLCGDLLFGKGKVYVTYGHEGCTTSAKVKVSVFDEGKNGQEINENGLPKSDEATQLTPDSGEINFVQPATQWNIWADKLIALGDGKSTVTLTIQVENPFMDIRQAVDGTVYVGGVAESGAVISWEGQTDSLNPTKANIVTDPVTGKAYLKLTSTKPGKAEITITGGKAYVCEKKRDDGYVCPTCERIYKMYDCEYSKDVNLQPKTIEVEFLEVASKQIFLDKGWNFISVPYALNTSADQLSKLFNMSNVAQAWSYNGGWTAMSGSSALGPLNGYWIKLLQPEVITLKYATPTMPSIPTRPIAFGWNAVGLAWDSPITMRNGLMSIDKIYSNVIGWISGLQKYAIPVANTGGSGPFETGGVNIEPKQGYWVWSTGSGTLAGLAA